MITKSEIHPQSYHQKSRLSSSSCSRSSDSGKATPPPHRRHITTRGEGTEIPTVKCTTAGQEEAEDRYPTKKPGNIASMARLYGGGDSLASGGGAGGESLGNGLGGPSLLAAAAPASSSTWTMNGGDNNIFGGSAGFGQNQNSNSTWMAGGGLLGDMTSPALGSVDTAASTQPPPSPLSPPAAGAGGNQYYGAGGNQYYGGSAGGAGGVGGSDEQGHQMLWTRSSTTGGGAAGGAQSSLWGSPSAAGANTAMGGVDASAAPWWPSPAGGGAGGGGSGPNPSGAGGGSGRTSAASSTATTPISNRQQPQQQQQPNPNQYTLNQAQAHPYPMNPQGQYQQMQNQMHRRSNSWNQDEALAAATGLSTPGHSPPRSGKKWKRGQAGAGDSSAGSSPSDPQKGGQQQQQQPPVDYTQPVSLEEAQAIAAAQQQQGGGPAVAAVGPWGTPQQHRRPVHPPHHQQQQHLQQGGPAIGPTSPQGPPSWVMGPGPSAGGGGTDHFMHQHQQAYHHQQSAPSPYVLRPRTDGVVGAADGGGGDGRGGEHPPQHHHHHPPRPPHQHPRQPNQHEQHRPPLQHHVSAPSSAPTSPQRGPASSYSSPGHPPASGGAGTAHHEHHPSTGTGRGGGAGGHHQPHPHGSGDRPPQHQQHRESHHPPTSSASSGSRAPSEVLKTLLRKKACLYEPNTSHAIATVTWLVGRNLTMSRGYFTRQSLQTGVHNVVDAKINAGAITRTKVNRCMQIILNSCFHYIIPRVDGSEEDGTAFSVEFIKSARVGDDATLLESLPPPWNDLEVPMEIAADPDEEEEVVAAPKSGRLGSQGSAKGGGGGYLTSKRSVLLCFNENVRCAQDVFRCHNEFIRDAAHSSNLHLTAEEWKSFFSGGISPVSPRFGPTPSGGKAPSTVSTGNSTPTSTGMSVSPASLSPAGIRPSNEGDVDTAGIQPPALTLGSAWTQAPGPTISLLPRMSKEKDAGADHDEGGQKGPTAAYRPAPLTGDVLGELTPVDLDKFRTTWCTKRYEHDPSICSFAHVEINGGWLRRDPVLFRYSPEMCPDIVSAAQVLGTTNVPAELKGCLFNRCPRGKNCDKAHSREEVQYHPDVYKKALCPSVRKGQEQDHGHHHHHHGGKSSKQPCKLRDVCPLLHPPGSVQPKEHHHGHGHHHHRGKGSGPSSGKNAAQAPALTAASGGPPIPGAPMLYIGPAPPSDFDAYLQMPGLQELFRRRSANLFHYYHKSSAGHTVGTYSIFGDNLGLSTEDGA